MKHDPTSFLRSDLAFIAHWVAPHTHVLDLGCGDGTMLDYLQSSHHCTGYGIEINDDNIPLCIERGVCVIQRNLETGLSIFPDQAFDTVLCLSALQMIQHVELILRDIARVGKEAIISFPNFAHWPHRLALLRGRMPVSRSLPYQWYDTPNVRCATIKDFTILAEETGFEVLDCVALKQGKPVSFLPNWRGDLAIFHLRALEQKFPIRPL